MDAYTFQQEAMRLERLLYRISYAMLRNQEDCADAVQEALLRAWQRRGTLREKTAFRSWLSRILVNTCNDMLRKRAKAEIVPLEENMAVQNADQSSLELREALDKLSPDQRTAVVLHYLEGWSVQEIAHAFDTPEGTVKTRLMYARRRLGEALREDEEVKA